jgi:hypothetical protein
MSIRNQIKAGTVTVITDTVAPRITAVTIANGTYAPGQTIDVVVSFSEALQTALIPTGGTSGAPTIDLQVGSAVRTLSAVSASQNTIVFRYTVESGIADTDGISVVGDSFMAASGVIRDLTGNAATTADLRFVTVTNSSAVIPAQVVTDTTPPNATITAVDGPPAAETATFTVVFSEAVQGVGATDFSVTGAGVGGTVTGVTAGADNSFTVTVGSITGAGEMSLAIQNAGITDLAGNAVGTVINTGSVRTVDRVAPAAFTVVPVSEGQYNSASSAGATFSLSGAEAGTTFTWVVKNGATATAVGNTTPTALPAGGVAMTGLDDLADGTYTLEVTLSDAAGNTTVRSAAISLDNTPPAFAAADPVQVVERSGDAAGRPYKAGDTIVVRLNFDGPVKVSGTSPTLELDIGGTPRTATYDQSLSTDTALAFTYTVVGTDNDANGIRVTNTIGNRASITDLAGNALPLTATFVALADQAGHKVDTNSPTATVGTVSGGFVSLAEANAGVLIGGTFATDAGDGTKILVTVGSGAAVEAALSGSEWSTTLTTAQIAALGDGAGRTVTVTATDAAGNSNSYQSPAFVIDRVAPLPTIALATGADAGLSTTDGITPNETPTLTVTLNDTIAEGDTLQLYVNGDATGASRTVTAAEKMAGSMTVTTPDLGADGSKSLTVQMADAAGNTGQQPTAITLQLDRTAPEAPTTDLDLSEASDSGSSSTDDITNVTTPSVRAFLAGTGAVVGDRVDVREGDTTVGSVVLSSDAQITNGFVDVTLATALAEGDRTLTMRVVDRAGNEGTPGGALTVTVDTTKLGAPTAAPDLVTDSDTGSSTTDNITNASTPTVSVSLAGTGAGEGDRIQVLVDGAVVGTPVTLVAADVTAESVDVVLNALGADGTKQITARAIDRAGNVGDAGPALAVTLDRVAPASSAITVDLLAADDSAAGGGTNADNRTNVTTLRFDIGFGTDVKEGDSVQLQVGGDDTGAPVVVAAADVTARKVTVTAGDLGTEGVKAITARITDVAGNESNASASLDVTLDTADPATPATPDLLAASDSGSSTTDNITNDRTPTIAVTLPTGTVVGELVEVLVGGTVVGSRIVSQDDLTATKVEITTDDLGSDDAKVVTARITDLAGNQGDASTALSITLDTTALQPDPAAITVDDVSLAIGETLTVTWDPTTNTDVASVSVDFSAIGGGAAVAATFDAVSGTWVAQYAPAIGLEVSGAVRVRFTDTAGNVSAATTDNTTVVVDTKAPTAATSGMDLLATSDSGVSDADDITSAATVSVKALLAGTDAKVGDLIQLFVDGSPIGAPVELGNATEHTFEGVTLTRSGTGTDNLIQFRVIDFAGNEGPLTGNLTIVGDDGAPPDAPTAAPTLKGTSDSGFSSTDGVTSATTPTIIVSLAGTNAVEGDVVKLFANGTATGSTLTLTAAQAAGTDPVEIPTGTLSTGVNAITARLMDKAGNETAASPELPITVDTVAPVATFTDAMAQTSPTSGAIILYGTGFDTILGASETADDDVKDRLDFAKITLDTTALTAADVDTAKVTTAGALTITLTASGQSTLAAAAVDGTVAIVVGAEFLADAAGNKGAASFGSTPAEIDFQSTTVDFGATPAGTLTVTNYAPSGTRIDIVGNSASEVTVGGSGNTTITAAGGGSVTLGGFTGSLDGSSVRFSDGTVLKRNTAGATSINGTNAGGGDQLIAGNSGDTLRGDAGDDLLIGGNGGDRLFGGSGNDRLLGGLGNDFLSGGTGQDEFVFEAVFGADRIADFTAGLSADSIDLQAGWTMAIGTGGVLTVRDAGSNVMGTIALLGQSFATQSAADAYLATITVV